jgi:hypothetical protein
LSEDTHDNAVEHRAWIEGASERAENRKTGKNGFRNSQPKGSANEDESHSKENKTSDDGYEGDPDSDSKSEEDEETELTGATQQIARFTPEMFQFQDGRCFK